MRRGAACRPFAAAALAAALSGCALLPPRPAVSVQVQDPPAREAAVPVAALHRLSGLPQRNGSHHLGITASELGWDSELSVNTLATPGGKVRAVPDTVAVTLQQTATINIAAEIPRDGCLWREVSAHEARHVAIDRRNLLDAAAALQDRLRNWARGAAAEGADAQAATDALRAELRAQIEAALTALGTRRDAENATIDTPEEYRRLSTVCPADQAVLARRLAAQQDRS